MVATKTARRRAARDVRELLSLYLMTLERWYGDSRTPETVAADQAHYLSLAEVRLKQLRDLSL